MTKKKKPRFGLIPAANHPKVRQFIDFDYLEALSTEELDWLNRFSVEFYGANFKNDETDLHDTVIKRRKIYNTNNARTRDVYNQLNRIGLQDLEAPEKEDEEDV